MARVRVSRTFGARHTSMNRSFPISTTTTAILSIFHQYRLTYSDRLWKTGRSGYGGAPRFNEGETTQETHPVLPEDRDRHNQLKQLLDGKLVIDPNNFIAANCRVSLHGIVARGAMVGNDGLDRSSLQELLGCVDVKLE